MTRKQLAIAAVLAALAVAGCGAGESDSNAFIRDFNQAQEPLRPVIARVQANPVKDLKDLDAYRAT